VRGKNTIYSDEREKAVLWVLTRKKAFYYRKAGSSQH